jgi:hypothetical protein
MTRSSPRGSTWPRGRALGAGPRAHPGRRALDDGPELDRALDDGPELAQGLDVSLRCGRAARWELIIEV